MSEEAPTACQHCGALVFPDTKRCPQCGLFPVKLHICARCKTVAGGDETVCPQCGKMFDPLGDYL